MSSGLIAKLEVGDLVRLRGREWTIEATPQNSDDNSLQAFDLACIDDDAQGERLRVVLEAELDLRRVENDLWQQIGRSGSDAPDVFAAHLRAVTWRSATAADRNLFQAPFRAGIRLDPYQLLPLAKALRLPRVNLLIADDVGLGKTVEAGLVLREMLLRRRGDYVVISSPAAMTAQWQDELAQKFGLSFTIIDRDYLAAVRRNYGFSANPWAVGSRFIISHNLLADETYSDGLAQLLRPFRPRAMFILDEAHHAAPASGIAYATDSQFTVAVRTLAELFEHRLFLSATPHNGHSNSFSSLLEILDPQRFTRGVPVEPADLEPVMVRRLKSDLLKLDVSRFPVRDVVPIVLSDLPADTPELVLSDLLDKYATWCEEGLQGTALRKARFVMSGLQQRLLSSIPAFYRSLRKHLETLKRHRDQAERAPSEGAAALMAEATDQDFSEEADEGDLLKLVEEQEEEVAEAATASILSSLQSFDGAITRVEAMLEIAKANERRSDARVRWLIDWIEQNLFAAPGRWNDRRLIIFTQWEDTRIWLERRLNEEFRDTDRGDERIATFTGITRQDRREQVKLAFNAPPAKEPLRILLCTDAAREGINLQRECSDLIHFDLPWNPSRLEQRNGRIDRKLQPAETVTCRYFVYAQRPEDMVLEALVRKTETISSQLGSAGQVLGERIHQKLAAGGIARRTATALARDIDAEDGGASIGRARRDMTDEPEKRLERLSREVGTLNRELELAKKRVGVEPDDLKSVVATALARDGVPLAPAADLHVDDAFRIDPGLPVFARDSSWADRFDELREGRPPLRRRQLAEWRAKRPVRAIAFHPVILPDGRDADGVVHVHPEHRLVRRLISRFVSHGFQAGLNRAAVIYGPGSQPRVVLVGRLALFGPAATRLHEEILPVTALWSEAARSGKGLQAFGRTGQQTTMKELEDALKTAAVPPRDVVDKLLAGVGNDLAALRPALEERARAAADEAKKDLADIASRESEALKVLLTAQRDRIRKAAASKDSDQLELDLSDPNERRQRAADRRHWEKRLQDLERELVEEPKRVAESYTVRAQRLEPVGIVYLWPRS